MLKPTLRLVLAAAALATGSTTFAKTPDGKTCILLLAGQPSHGPGEHEHNAGVKLLAKCLAQGAPNVVTKVHLSADWPNAEELAQADTILFYADGGGGHFMLSGDHLAQTEKEMKRGAGFICLHYAVEFPADHGGPQALDWMGGFFEADWSVNPHWQADFQELPKHPVSNGVKPFRTNDEWYFHMRFNERAGKLTHVLSAIAPANSVSAKDDPHGGNPAAREAVAAKKPQTTAWAFERPDGGRGFGFTGGHFHKGWGNDDQRKLILNAILWTAKADVPAGGVESKISAQDLEENLDPKGAPKPKAAAANPAVKPVFASKLVHLEPVEIKADLKGAKELFLAVTDGGDGFVADWADWMEPTLIKADGSTIKLTDLKPKKAQVGWGEVSINTRADGQKPMRVNGQDVAFGIGTHAPALVAYDLPEGVVGFAGKGGVDEGGTSQNTGATVVFQVFTQDPGSTPLAPAGGTRYGLESAKANMAAFKTPDGLQPSLVAAEPMIQNPTNIDIDPRGRIWAVECLNYRGYMTMRPEGDRVVILEDTNGDGIADKDKTFYQNPAMTNPLGILVLPQAKGTKVIVSAAPNVWLLTDKDGDDVAEDARIIFKVGGVWNYDHQVHAFVFGPDGKFYFNAGNSITELFWPDGSIVKDLAGHEITGKGQPYRQGMVYRCDLDLETGKATNVETLGHNFRNNYEVCIDSFGTLWQSDNDDDGNKGVRINYVMEHGNFGYTDEMTGAGWQSPRTNLETEIPLRHWHLNDPGVVPNLLQTGGGSPTGILFNEGMGLGAQFANQLIHCDAGPRVVRAYPVENDGAGYKATMVDVLTSSDPWYRVSDLCIAPDGSLVVADWYDPGVGGHAMGDHEKGKIMGRIYRVSATGGAAKAPAVDVRTAAGAVQALQSPNRATQYLAWTALHKLGTEAEFPLLTLWKSENPRLRARALGLLAQIKGSETKYLTAGLSDPDPNIRIAAVRLSVLLATSRDFDTHPLEENRDLMVKLINDASPQVRRQIALALYGAKDIAKIWTALALQHTGNDRWYLEALGIAATGHEDACFDAWLAAVGDKWNTPGGRDIIWRLRSAKNPDYLAKLLEDKSTADTEKSRYLRAFDFLPPTPEKTKALIELVSAAPAGGIVREALARLKGSSEPAVAEALKRELEKVRGTAAFVELVREFGVKGQGAALVETALKLGNDPLAIDAVKLVFTEPNPHEIFQAAVTGPQSAEVLNLLVATGNKQAISRVAGMINGVPVPDIQKAAIRALARTQDGAEKIIALAKEQKLPAELASTAGSALRLVQYASLKIDIDTLFPAPSGLGGKPLPPIADLAKIKGDVEKGRAIYERAESSCITCHQVGNKGVNFAPALTEIGSKLPKDQLYEAIINPNSGLSMGFETTQLTLKDGGVGLGIVRSETNEEVILALPGGASNKFDKKQIAKREKLTTSLMPSGLNQALSQDDLINLVEYLFSLRTVK